FYLIDFGLCKRLQIKDGVVIKPPQNGNFRGTMRYASIQAHKKEELGRNDDLMSLFYIMIEFYVGKLPWLNVFDKDEVHRLKENFRQSDLLKNQLPKQFLEIERYITNLDYIETPDYEKIKRNGRKT
ncbi:MAG: putative tau-tubulin kinase 1, partial [Streblomastix strix]